MQIPVAKRCYPKDQGGEEAGELILTRPHSRYKADMFYAQIDKCSSVGIQYPVASIKKCKYLYVT